MLAGLPKLDTRVADPKSEVDHQPPYAKNEDRSIKPEIFVAIGICTHLGCIPTFRPEVAPADPGPDWLGGFSVPAINRSSILPAVCSRAYLADQSLIPPYKFLSDSMIRVGDDSKPA